MRSDPLARQSRAAAALSAADVRSISARGVMYDVQDHGWTMNSPRGTIYNTCLYNTTYSFLTLIERVTYPTLASWRTAVIGQLDQGAVGALLAQALANGAGVYGQKSIPKYKALMLNFDAMGGPIEVWAAAQLLGRAFCIVQDDGTGVHKVHPVMGPHGVALADGAAAHYIFLRRAHWKSLALAAASPVASPAASRAKSAAPSPPTKRKADELDADEDTEGDDDEEDGVDVGTPEWLFPRFKGATGELVTLRTTMQRQRKTVLELTGLVVYPLGDDASHALAQSATESPNWAEQKTRRQLSGRELVAQLRRDDFDGMAELIAGQNASVLFFYGADEYCDVHFDKSQEDERWMARLVETPDTIHYIMIQGRDGVVYNVEMQGSFAYYGQDGTLLSKRRHAVPMPAAGGGDVTTLLISLAVDAGDFDAQFKALLKGFEKTKELWVDFECVKYKRSSADIKLSDKVKGGA